jgi:hypothetical protein
MVMMVEHMQIDKCNSSPNSILGEDYMIISTDLKNPLTRAGRVTQMVELLPSKHDALSSTPLSTTKSRKEKKREEKSFDKMKHSIMIKALKKLRIKRMFLNIKNAVNDKPIAKHHN